MLQSFLTEQVHAHIDIESMRCLGHIDAYLSESCVLFRLAFESD